MIVFCLFLVATAIVVGIVTMASQPTVVEAEAKPWRDLNGYINGKDVDQKLKDRVSLLKHILLF